MTKIFNKNGIDVIVKNNKKTPRMAMTIHFETQKPEKFAGVYSLFTKLLLQGTKTCCAKELTDLIENNGIEVDIKNKQDYFCISTLFLNEDFELATSIVADIVQNSTFDDFEKEVHKIKGEIKSELDIPRVIASDAFVSAIFKDHCYSNSHTKILSEVDKIKKDDVVAVLEQLFASKKVISIVGDIEDPDKMAEIVSKKFAFLATKSATEGKNIIPEIAPILKDEIIKIEKNDVKQAQVIQGFQAVNFEHADYPKIIVMNNILGSSGLSSRLFVELRDKKGLAYTVRSSFEALKHGAIIHFYIATDPKNIKASLDGFRVEIKKLQTEPVSDSELQGGKENVLGRLEYFMQTNIQQASTFGYDYTMGLGIDYEEKYRKMIAQISATDIMQVAQKYFSKPSVIVVLAPGNDLKFT